MEKVKFENGKVLEFNSINKDEFKNELTIEFINKTIEELQADFTQNNLTNLSVLTEGGVVATALHGYTDVDQYIIKGTTIMVVLKKVDATQEKINALTNEVAYLKEQNDFTAIALAEIMGV